MTHSALYNLKVLWIPLGLPTSANLRELYMGLSKPHVHGLLKETHLIDFAGGEQRVKVFIEESSYTREEEAGRYPVCLSIFEPQQNDVWYAKGFGFEDYVNAVFLLIVVLHGITSKSTTLLCKVRDCIHVYGGCLEFHFTSCRRIFFVHLAVTSSKKSCDSYRCIGLDIGAYINGSSWSNHLCGCFSVADYKEPPVSFYFVYSIFVILHSRFLFMVLFVCACCVKFLDE
ncbi:uncharacterized protein LOC131166366 isoform X3 [Malania oleifera]|uniref:uncharacterized protein LOC131166366 isoform X3 n=1 Tax=Malania oleifera TaxID=397392 RepID=UPI0025AE7D7F|nr:uncharacterized protein LOC131166366 isoform X3 [Malania oleifera]